MLLFLIRFLILILFYGSMVWVLYDMIKPILQPRKIKCFPINSSEFYSLPIKGSDDAAGFDLYWSTVNKDLNDDGSVTIEPGESLIFGTNMILEIPKEYYLDICSRSGRAIKEKLVVINSPARIDSDYRGELLISIINLGKKSVVIEPKSRIAQCTLHKIIPTEYNLDFGEISETERGSGGLGHSGNK